MCGICGLLGSDAPDPGLVEAMNAAIVHRGPDHGTVESLEGMFAIALWDRVRERLVLARDRLGKKPLLYAHLPDGTLAFASETKALLQLPDLPRELDLEQLDAYLALQYVPRSGLRAVQQVPPGSYLVAEAGARRTERYWTPKPSNSLLQGEEVARV